MGDCMLFMLGLSIQMMVLVLLTPHFWAGAVALGIGTYLARRRGKTVPPPPRPRSRMRAAAALLCLFLAPLAMLAWGLYFWPADAAGRGAHELLALRGLYALAAIELGACLFVVWRQRGQPRAVAVAALAIWWTAAAYATAGMAITNTWL